VGIRLLLVAAALLGGAGAGRAGTPRAECFPVESLPPDLRAKADELLLRLLDSEGVYTAAGGLKPLSDGFWRASFPATANTSPEVEEARRILATFRCGDDLTAGVLVFAAAFDGKKTATAFVANRPAVRGVVRRHPAVFGPLGVTILTDPQQVLEAVDRADASTRWRAFGLLFGYPEHAVEFFVRAGEEEKRTKKFVPRDFVHLPTFGKETGRFVYAVPKGHAANFADASLRERAKDRFAEYARRRAVYVGDGKPGPAALVRDWLDDGTGWCSEATADPTRLRVAPAAAAVTPCDPARTGPRPRPARRP
jgi:hypothetical protein